MTPSSFSFLQTSISPASAFGQAGSAVAVASLMLWCWSVPSRRAHHPSGLGEAGPSVPHWSLLGKGALDKCPVRALPACVSHLLSSVGRSLSAQLLEQTARLLALKNSVDSLRVRQAPPALWREGGCPGGTPGPALLFPWPGEGEMNGHVSL